MFHSTTIAPAASTRRALDVRRTERSRAQPTWCTRSEYHVRYLQDTLRARFSSLDDRPRLFHIFKCRPCAENDRPDLPNNLRSSWKHNSVRDDVRAMIEKDDLLPRVLHPGIRVSNTFGMIILKSLTSSKIFCIAFVSSVFPSPFAPRERTLTNWSTAKSLY